MKLHIKRDVQLNELAKILQVDRRLIKASNHTINNIIKRHSLIKVPGYSFSHYKMQVNESVNHIKDRFNLSNSLFVLFNDLNENPTSLVIPKRINEHIINDIDQYTFEKMQTHINLLTDYYPFIRKKIIGYSVLNKPIIELTVGTGSYYTHFNASFHGNEWITTPILLKCLNEYALALTNHDPDKQLIKSFEKMTLSIVAMVNPDGVNLVINGLDSAEQFKNHVYNANEKLKDFSRWKANILGVDLNKQFPANWEVEKERLEKTPCYRDYPGEKPLSENESMIMAGLTRNNNFHRVHALHTQGEEIYWGFNGVEPGISRHIAEYYEKATSYKAVQYIDNYAGYKDWFIKSFRRPGFTIELGKGINPLPISQFEAIYKNMLQLFLANLKLVL